MTPGTKPEAVRTTALVAAIIVVVNIASVVLDQRDQHFAALTFVDLGHALIAAVVAVALQRARRLQSLVTCEIAFVVVTAPFLVGIWLPQIYDLRGGHLVEPMLAHHFLLLGIAVAAPSLRIGVALIGVFAAHAVVLSQVLLRGMSTPSLDHEPWFTLLFTVIAGVLLYTRSRRRELEHRLAAAEARAHTLGQVSRVLLALRDRANTPLQTLEIAIALLEQDASADAARFAQIRRALTTLITIQQTLANTDSLRTDLDVSPDLELALRELLKSPAPEPSGLTTDG